MEVWIVIGYSNELGRRVIMNVFNSHELAKAFIGLTYADDDGYGCWSNIECQCWKVKNFVEKKI